MDYAKNALVFYFRTLFNANGFNWDSDNEVEIEGIVDSLYKDIKKEILKEVKENWNE